MILTDITYRYSLSRFKKSGFIRVSHHTLMVVLGTMVLQVNIIIGIKVTSLIENNFNI